MKKNRLLLWITLLVLVGFTAALVVAQEANPTPDGVVTPGTPAIQPTTAQPVPLSYAEALQGGGTEFNQSSGPCPAHVLSIKANGQQEQFFLSTSPSITFELSGVTAPFNVSDDLLSFRLFWGNVNWGSGVWEPYASWLIQIGVNFTVTPDGLHNTVVIIFDCENEGEVSEQTLESGQLIPDRTCLVQRGVILDGTVFPSVITRSQGVGLDQIFPHGGNLIVTTSSLFASDNAGVTSTILKGQWFEDINGNRGIYAVNQEWYFGERQTAAEVLNYQLDPGQGIMHAVNCD